MTRWLLAAEADKIQDFIFRSSRLVQVVGGSGLLARFCDEAPGLIMERHIGRTPDDEDIIIADGGSFLLAFDDKDKASAAGDDLAEAYYRATEGSLTVAEPQPFNGSDFSQAGDRARSDLRAKKANRRGQQIAAAHIPYTAICASCGISLAVEYGMRHADDIPNYLCAACRDKAAERDLEQRSGERFLSSFLQALKATDLAQDLTEERIIARLFPVDADEVGKHDPRGYVAYLVADGNGMGVFFSECQSASVMQDLSDRLTQVLWNALAQATEKQARHLWKDRRKNPIPVTPLIVGGDDLFALVAAPYALDFARQVCLAFEHQFQTLLKDLDLPNTLSRPTLSAAVVICKKNYPYALAHRQGEALLERTKQFSRAARLKNGVNLSAVSFTLVKGGDVELQGHSGKQYIVPGLTSYWVAPGSMPDAAWEYTHDLQQLLKARYDLRGLPGKRRAELRELFVARLPAQAKGVEEALLELQENWRPRLDMLLGRVGRSPAMRTLVEDALGRLGEPGTASQYFPWRRFGGRQEKPFGHGMTDLLEMWSFAQDLKYNLEAYEAEEEGR